MIRLPRYLRSAFYRIGPRAHDPYLYSEE